ncbi:MAG: OmpA family protein [Bacteroidales bacterium]
MTNNREMKKLYFLLLLCIGLGITLPSYAKNAKDLKNQKVKKGKIVNPWLLTSLQKSYVLQGVSFDKQNFKDRRKDFKTAKQNLKQGIKLYEEGRRVEALPFFVSANEFNSDNLLLNYLLGKSYFISSMTRLDAEPYILKALAIDSLNKEANYLYGRLCASKYLLDSAIGVFQKCLILRDIDSIYWKNCVQRIKECNYAKNQMQKPARVFVDNLGVSVNTPYPDYAPLLNADELTMYFTSIRPGAVGDRLDYQTGLCFEDAYMAQLDSLTDTIWETVNMGKPVNTEGHDATAGLSLDGQKIYIYRGVKRNGDIYIAKLDSIDWKRPKSMAESRIMDTKVYQEKTVSLNFDGRKMFFISDRPGGYGGLDIWTCEKDSNDKWGNPINLGPVINTTGDELAVAVQPDGKSIFFSSNGHETMGGLDVLYSEWTDTVWSVPINMGWPINTVENDAFYTRSLDGKNAYYASERLDKTIGGYDIYKITYMGEEKGVVTQSEDQLLAYVTKPVGETIIESAAVIKITPITLLKGFVYDDFTKKPLKAQVIMVDNDLKQEIAVFESNAVSGKFMVTLPAGHNYGITVKCDGYLFHSENFDISAESEYAEVSKDFPLKNITVGSKVVLRNLFFEVDKATLLPASYTELERLYKLMEEVPTIKIEISGHTDNTGSVTHNQKLSENRARAVVDYLVARGMSVDRLLYKGYGLDQPCAPNTTVEGRALNRRTEFKIIENNENIKK